MVRVLGFIILMFAVTAPVDAQSRRELAARLDAAEARLAEIEARALQGDPVAERLTSRLDALEREQQSLTGELERLGFENRRLRAELEAMGRDVEALLAQPVPPATPETFLDPSQIDPNDPFAVERAGSVQPLQAPPGQVAQAPGGQLPPATNPGRVEQSFSAEELRAPVSEVVDPETVFDAGRNRLLEGDFGGAREAFADYTNQFPDGDQAGEAWYWLGETHFISGEFNDAANAYIASLQQDRGGPRAPDALVKLGASFAEIGDTTRACQILATFPAEFPNASDDARRKAQREVARIGCS